MQYYTIHDHYDCTNPSLILLRLYPRKDLDLLYKIVEKWCEKWLFQNLGKP